MVVARDFCLAKGSQGLRLDLGQAQVSKILCPMAAPGDLGTPSFFECIRQEYECIEGNIIFQNWICYVNRSLKKKLYIYIYISIYIISC